jgi:hypothetical protein
MGFDSKAVINGDVTQSICRAARHLVGLIEARRVLADVPGIAFRAVQEDVVRHRVQSDSAPTTATTWRALGGSGEREGGLAGRPRGSAARTEHAPAAPASDRGALASFALSAAHLGLPAPVSGLASGMPEAGEIADHDEGAVRARRCGSPRD